MTRCLTADRVVPASSAACPLSPPSRHDLANILSDGKLSADLWCIYRDFMFRSNVYLLFYVRISYCWRASVSMGWVLVLRQYGDYGNDVCHQYGHWLAITTPSLSPSVALLFAVIGRVGGFVDRDVTPWPASASAAGVASDHHQSLQRFLRILAVCVSPGLTLRVKQQRQR